MGVTGRAGDAETSPVAPSPCRPITPSLVTPSPIAPSPCQLFLRFSNLHILGKLNRQPKELQVRGATFQSEAQEVRSFSIGQIKLVHEERTFQVKCRNCERNASWSRTRCPACQTKLPLWYLVASIMVLVAIYAAFLLLENFF